MKKKEELCKSFLERDFGRIDEDLLSPFYVKTNLERLFEQMIMQRRHKTNLYYFWEATKTDAKEYSNWGGK
jgi:hypothetical protein